MSQRRTVSGRRSALVWLAVVVVLMLAVALAAVVFIIGPQQQLRQQAQATAEARQAEVERLYVTGVAFQDAGDCEQAAESLTQLIRLEPGYKDAQSRLAEVRACQQAAETTATAQAIAMAQATAQAQTTVTAEAIAVAEQARLDVRATATAQVQATATVQAVAATATMDAVEIHYQKGLAYVKLQRWSEAQVELEAVFEADPNYKDVQAQLAMVNSGLIKLTPTATPTLSITPTPTESPTPIPSPTVVYEPVPLQPISNYEFSTDIPNPPTGDQVFAGTPFSIPTSGFNRFETQCRSLPSFPTEGTVTVSIRNAVAVHVLIAGGYVLPEFAGRQVGRIVLHFSDASTYEEVIVAGRNIREHWLAFDGGSVNTITDPDCQTVWQRDTALIDMCTIPLLESYQEKVLTRITFEDMSVATVDSVDPSLMIGGVTVARKEYR